MERAHETIDCGNYVASYELRDNHVRITIFRKSDLQSAIFCCHSKCWIYMIEHGTYIGMLHIMAWLDDSLPDGLERTIPQLLSSTMIKERQKILGNLAEQGVNANVINEITLYLLDM